MCPFFLEYEREVEMKTGRGLSTFRLKRFELTHSHPLSLEYER